MKITNYVLAKPIVETITNIEELIEDHDLGRVSKSEHFGENSDDFYNAKLFNIINYTGTHSTGSGSCDVGRVMVSRSRDKSGANYVLDKQEIIQLQKFIFNMLRAKEEELSDSLERIE